MVLLTYRFVRLLVFFQLSSTVAPRPSPKDPALPLCRLTHLTTFPPACPRPRIARRIFFSVFARVVSLGVILHGRLLGRPPQPPLQFYMHAIQNGNWDQVDIVTYAPDEASLNPVVPALREKLEAGEISGNINIHTVSRVAQLLLSLEHHREIVFCAFGVLCVHCAAQGSDSRFDLILGGLDKPEVCEGRARRRR